MTLKTFNALHKTSCDKGECFQLALSTLKPISFLPDVTTQVSNFNRLCSKTSEENQNKKKNKGSGYRPSSRWSNQRQRRSGGTLVNIGWFTFLFCCFLFVFLCQRSAWSFSSRSARGTQAYYGKPVDVHTWVNKIETEALAVAVNASLLTELMNCCQVEVKTASTVDVDRDAFPSHHVKAKSQ